MAFIKSKKVYAILMNDSEGRKIVEKVSDMTDEQLEKELDAFFGNRSTDDNRTYGESKGKKQTDNDDGDFVSKEKDKTFATAVRNNKDPYRLLHQDSAIKESAKTILTKQGFDLTDDKNENFEKGTDILMEHAKGSNLTRDEAEEILTNVLELGIQKEAFDKGVEAGKKYIKSFEGQYTVDDLVKSSMTPRYLMEIIEEGIRDSGYEKDITIEEFEKMIKEVTGYKYDYNKDLFTKGE